MNHHFGTSASPCDVVQVGSSDQSLKSQPNAGDNNTPNVAIKTKEAFQLLTSIIVVVFMLSLYTKFSLITYMFGNAFNRLRKRLACNNPRMFPRDYLRKVCHSHLYLWLYVEAGQSVRSDIASHFAEQHTCNQPIKYGGKQILHFTETLKGYTSYI